MTFEARLRAALAAGSETRQILATRRARKLRQR
jgi:hypothetical protein